MNKTTTAILAASALFMLAPVAQAQDVESPHIGYRETGSVKDWIGIHSPDRGTEKETVSCAIYSRPTTSSIVKNDESIEALRGELAAFIAWDDSEVAKSSGEVSFMVGVPVVEGMDKGHVLSIDDKTKFELVGVDDRLYVAPKDDKKVISAIRGGVEMSVSAKSLEGDLVKDTYSLMGVQDMTAKQQVECQ